jgi:histidinol dehydrogenase
MPLRLDSRDAGFASAFSALVDARREADEDVSRDVAAIIRRVRTDGDAALADYTQRFDRHDLDVSGWAVTAAETRAALEGISTPLRAAARRAGTRRRAHRRLS